MNARWLVCAAAAVALLAASPLPAQTTPSEAATGFLTAWNARRWNDAARLLDLDQFDNFRREFAARTAKGGDDAPRMTVEDLMRYEPSMPREVAEYQVRMMEEQRRRFADPTPWEFARVATASALTALSPAEAAARWIESRDPEWQVRMQFQQAGCAVPSDLGSIAAPRRSLVGVLEPTGDVTYAVFREAQPNSAPSFAGGDLSVMELRLKAGRWQVAPRADLLPEVGEVDLSDCRGGR
ncbi:MAG: hypothetical protein ACYC2K_07125 [Gemmatimonadales bacterium]